MYKLLTCSIIMMMLTHSSINAQLPETPISSTLLSTANAPLNTISLSVLTSTAVSVIADIASQDYYLVSKLVSAYELVVSDMNIMTLQNNDMVTNQRVIDNQSDFGVTGIAPDQEATHHTKRDDLLLLPAFASSVVITYRVDSLDYDNSIPIVLSRSVLAMIFEGTITSWSDPAIVNLNPALKFPHLNITVIIPSNEPALTLAFTTAIHKFSSTHQMKPSTSPIWPIERYSRYQISNVSNDVAVSIDGCISYTSISSATHYKLRYASLINKAGYTIEATPSSINYALIELGSLQSPNTQMFGSMAQYDITDATGPNAYPIVSISYMFASSTVKRNSCAVRTGMAKFWLWFYQSSSVIAIMRALQVSLMPDVIMTERKIIDILSNRMSCDQHIITVNAERTTVDVHGEPWLGVFTDVLLGFYQQQDGEHEFRFHPSNTWSAYSQIDQAEVDAALVLDSFLSPEQYADPELVMIPTWLSGVGPIFHFDPRVTMTTSHNDGQLILDLNTLYRIFMGEIDDWLHPSIIANNPDLPQRFGYNSNNNTMLVSVPSIPVPSSITVIVTRTKTRSVAEPIGDSFAQGLRRPDLNIPFDWTQIASKFPKRFIVADSPDQVTSLVKRTPGSIGYQLINVPVVDPSLHVSMVSVDADGTKHVVKGDNPALAACLKRAYAIDPTLVSTPLSNISNPECWPFTTLLSFIVRQRYVSTSGSNVCTRANATLSLLRFFQTNDQLSSPLNAQGVVSVGVVPQLKHDLLEKLNRITCDGETLLITYPFQWNISRSIQIFGYVFSTIGIVYCIGLIVFVIYNRHHGVIRSASMIFLLVTLCGVILLFTSGIFLVAQASYSSCGGFVWTASLGFMLTFAPLFAKTWRIYRIFGRKALKVIKISNRKLGVLVGSLIAIDTIMLIAWQSTSPMAPQIATVMEGQRFKEYSHCSISSKGTPFLVVLLSIKAALLVFGALMALSTRRVASAYNESQAVAWSIYNTVFSICIVVPISIFTSSIGDSLILLMIFLLLWISFFTVSAMFIPKVLSLVRPDAAGLHSISESGEYREVSNGFSFLSPKMLSRQILQKYVVALEIQLTEAKARLATFGSKFSADNDSNAVTAGGQSYQRYISTESSSHQSLKFGVRAAANLSQPNTNVRVATATLPIAASSRSSSLVGKDVSAAVVVDPTRADPPKHAPTSNTPFIRPRSYSSGSRSFSPSSRSAIETRANVHVVKAAEQQIQRRDSVGNVAASITNALSTATGRNASISAPVTVLPPSTADEISESRPSIINGYNLSPTQTQQSIPCRSNIELSAATTNHMHNNIKQHQ